MDAGGDLDEPRPPPPPPTVVWMMLGGVLVLVFIAVLVIVFEVPALKAAARGPVQRMPAPPQQVAPATPTPTPEPTDVR